MMQVANKATEQIITQYLLNAKKRPTPKQLRKLVYQVRNALLTPVN